MFASLIAAAVFAADAPAPRPARWTLLANPGVCELERREVDPLVRLSIGTTPGSDDYRLVFASPTIRKRMSPLSASLAFAPSQRVLNGRASTGALPDGSGLLWMEGVPPTLLDDLSGADMVTMSSRAGDAVVRVAGSANAVKALRRCIADQLIEWGADPLQFAPGGTTPAPLRDRDSWLSPKELLTIIGESKSPDVDATFRLGVSPEGVVDDCHAMGDKVGQRVEHAACVAVTAKPLFVAAKGPDGKPVRGVATFRVRLMSRPGG